MNDLLQLLHLTGRPLLSRARDLVDILFVAYAVYRLLLFLRGTRALQVGQGLLLLALVYFAVERLGLVTAYTLLDRSIPSLLLVVVVIFQGDIRRALMRVGNQPFFFRWRRGEETGAVDEVVRAAEQLAHKRIGALIVFERDAALDDFVSHGTVLDAAVTSDLLYTVFLPAYENPLHDGAVVIRAARVWRAGGVLPLTANPSLDSSLGTRHRAALGLSEETDAVVVVVSEERGQVSLCFNGNIVRNLDADSLRRALFGLFYTKRQAAALIQERASLVPKAPSAPPAAGLSNEPAAPARPGAP
ncbi:MAG: diadenylate cyclase CdaA [Polyangiales bacterium]